MENPQEEEIQEIIGILKNLDLEVGSLQKILQGIGMEEQFLVHLLMSYDMTLINEVIGARFYNSNP